jgi:hypothetical protein
MTKPWIAVLAFVFVLSAAGVAAAQCPDPGNMFVVDTAAEAAGLANGYADKTCDIVIKTSITPATANFQITARSIQVLGPDVLDTTRRTSIINTVGGSKVFLTADGGNLVMNEADVRAFGSVQIKCLPADCDVTITLSDVIAASTLLFGGPGGILQIKAEDALTITGSTVYGGANVLITSNRGTTTFICQPGAGGCRSPLSAADEATFPNPIAASNVVSQLLHAGGPATCADRFAASLPCTVTFLDQAELRAVCIQAPGVNCGGGSKEIHITARIDVHIENSQIDSTGTFLIRASTGRIFGANAQLTANKFEITGNGDGVNPAVDFSGATLAAASSVRITGQTCPAPPAVCVDLEGADVTANAGTSPPNVNGDSAPPYSPNVLDEAPGECAVAVQTSNAQVVIRAQNGAGVVSLCGALFNIP